MFRSVAFTLASLLWCATPRLAAQAAPGAAKPELDVLIFTDGEKLIGRLVRATGAAVTFHSDMAGDVTADWSKIQELHSTQPFAVVPKNVKLARREQTSGVPQGIVSMSNQTLSVAGAAGAEPRKVPVADTAYVIDQHAFERAVLHSPGFFEAWKGAVTAGATLVEATENSRTFSGAVNLVRAVPAESWLDLRNRTSFNFNAAYGTLSQAKTPTIKTEIYHADLERDQYFTASRAYAFAQTAFDHNFSQGLDLQQTYGGGIGWTVVKTAHASLDLKGSMIYLNQRFQAPARTQNLAGSAFAESWRRGFAHGVTLVQQLQVTPAWNNTAAYSAAASASLTAPVYKRINFSIGTLDAFLNNPPPGFKKNSYQFTTGFSYTLP